MAERASEQSIFLHAIGLSSSAQRAAYLDEVCKENIDLRSELDALLAVHNRLGSVGDEPQPGTMLDAGSLAVPGQVIAGRFTLLEPIGEGGMGTVWMAQQLEPVKRLVAIKLIKPGMDSRQVLTRFEAERQALALMDHPNIAKVFDAGTTSDSRPFFVMELVKGIPITHYCDEHQLTPRQRLELFVPVCQAIQHAHQKGIIHRDIKPSNVLVALYDDRPVPKVIDFGVAKATCQQLTESTLHTVFGTVVGTMEYMSPEQASFNQLDVDTRSDIYSLGVLLYELLAGSPPFTKKELEKAGVMEMLRIIREQEPSKPSTKLSSSDALPSLSANRGTEPSRLTKLVRGELDWIVMKALEKDRNRRYETANGFAMDVQHYLADEPVLANPPSACYLLRKWAWRHRNIVWATAISVAALLVALAAVTWQWRVAVQARNDKEKARTAEREQRLEAEANWAASLISLADRDWVLGDLDKVRQTLDRCPVNYRNDEWRRLHMVSHAEIASVLDEATSVGFTLPQFSPDGKGIVTAWPNKIVWHAGDDYCPTVLCDIPKGATIARYEVGSIGADLTVTLIQARTVDDRQAPAAVGIFDPRANRWLSQWNLGKFGGCRVSPGGRLVAQHDGKTVVIHDAGTGKVLPAPPISLHEFSAFNATRLAGFSTNSKSEIVVWDIASGALVQQIPVVRSPAALVALTPDGEYVSYLSNRQSVLVAATVYSVRHGGVVGKLEATGIISQAFSPDSRIFAFGRADGTVHLWDFARSGRSIILRGHTSSKGVTGIGFSPDGLRMVSVAQDKLLKVWDLRQIREHFDALAGDVAFASKAPGGE